MDYLENVINDETINILIDHMGDATRADAVRFANHLMANGYDIVFSTGAVCVYKRDDPEEEYDAQQQEIRWYEELEACFGKKVRIDIRISERADKQLEKLRGFLCSQPGCPYLTISKATAVEIAIHHLLQFCEEKQQAAEEERAQAEKLLEENPRYQAFLRKVLRKEVTSGDEE